MKLLILCAGYATRMYPLTKDKPKALLPVANKPVIEYILANFNQIPEIDTIYVITNAKYHSHFLNWMETYHIRKEMQIISDGTISNDARLGAIKDIQLAIEELSIKDDLLIAASDNLFTFDVRDFIKFFMSRGISVCIRQVNDKQLLTNYNEVKLDSHCRLVSFTEKPRNPQYTLAAICVYIFPRGKLRLINEYLIEGKNPDDPGRLIQWLHKREDVFGYLFSGKWCDIGNIEQYKRVNQESVFCITKNTEP